jgi:TPR repeat protein
VRVAEEEVKDAECLRMFAGQRSSNAHYADATALRGGLLAPKDKARLLEHLKQAAGQGQRGAQHRYGVALAEETDVAKDLAKAREYCQMFAVNSL